MIWGGIRDFLVEDMNPLSGMHSSLAGSTRGLSVWSYIQMPAKSVILWIRGGNSNNDTNAQINLRESKKYGG